MLEQADMKPDTVPETGQTVLLRSTANLSTGGTATDVTDVIHPDNREMAERAVRAIGLDVGGVDFLSKDITESYRTIGGGICEVNAAPGFRMHVAPSEGTRPRRGRTGDRHAVSRRHFGTSADRRCDRHQRQDHHGAHARAYHQDGRLHARLTTTDGVYIDGQRTVQGDMTGPVSARMVLADPQIDIAVLETARGGLLRAGMGVSEVNVGAVLNVQSDHLGLKGIDTLEQLGELKRIVVEVATDCAVLNADDPLVLKMSGHTEAKTICYVTMNPHHALVREHIRAGGRACALEAGVNGQMMTLYDRGGHIPLLWTHLIPGDPGGPRNPQCAECHVRCRHGVFAGHQTGRDTPGPAYLRFDLLPGAGPHECVQRAPVQGAVRLRAQRARRRHDGRSGSGLDVTGRRIVVLAGPGDRRDEDLVAIAKAVAGRFDHYICRRDDNLRDRAADEVPRIQAQALRAAGVPGSAISIIPDEQDAIDAALRMGEPGDLLLIFADALARSWKQITKFKAVNAAAPTVPRAPAAHRGIRCGHTSAAPRQRVRNSIWKA